MKESFCMCFFVSTANLYVFFCVAENKLGIKQLWNVVNFTEYRMSCLTDGIKPNR